MWPYWKQNVCTHNQDKMRALGWVPMHCDWCPPKNSGQRHFLHRKGPCDAGQGLKWHSHKLWNSDHGRSPEAVPGDLGQILTEHLPESLALASPCSGLLPSELWENKLSLVLSHWVHVLWKPVLFVWPVLCVPHIYEGHTVRLWLLISKERSKLWKSLTFLFPKA